MILSKLLEQIDINNNTFNISLLKEEVKGITSNSKLVKSNYVFIAIKGKITDGHLFVKDALNNGALVVLVQSDGFELVKNNLSINDLHRVVVVKNTRLAVSILSKTFYNYLPSNIIAVTGTNGKTSVSSIVVQILSYLQINNVQIGTLGLFYNNKKQSLNTGLTTPIAEDIFHILDTATKNNIDYAIMEVSSEGIAEGRVQLLPFTIAAFTNLSQDHLNYHKNIENYFASKSQIFTENLQEKHGIAIINSDDLYGKKLIQICKKKNITTLTYGVSSNILTLIKQNPTYLGNKITFLYQEKEYVVEIKLPGYFQTHNFLCALLIILNLQLGSIEKILEAVNYVQGIPGRLELIRVYNQAKVFIDYAHTPDALEKVLHSLREITQNKLYVVFGCGGNRDIQKRQLMGSIANKLADYSYITDDNPRYENPASIRKQIILGFATNNYLDIANREQAIITAMKILRPGDTLLVAGKGHEEVQIIKDKIKVFSDKKIILGIKDNYDIN